MKVLQYSERFFLAIKYWLLSLDRYSLQSKFIYHFYQTIQQLKNSNKYQLSVRNSKFDIKEKYLNTIFYLLEEQGLSCFSLDLEKNVFLLNLKGAINLLPFDSGLNLSNQSYISFIILTINRESVADFLKLQSRLSSNAIVICVGINTCFSNEKLWSEMYASEQVQCSVDLFEIGILFYDKNYNKNHYILNY